MVQNRTTAIKGIEQGRANFAYKKALEARDELGLSAQKYKAYVRRAPMRIKTNGLGPTLAFMVSKIKDSEEGRVYRLIYKHLTEWLKEDNKGLITIEGDLAQAVISLESPEYRAVTLELLAFLNWLRRFADGLIEGEADDE